MNKWVPEQPRPWRKSCEGESCYVDRGYAGHLGVAQRHMTKRRIHRKATTVHEAGCYRGLPLHPADAVFAKLVVCSRKIHRPHKGDSKRGVLPTHHQILTHHFEVTQTCSLSGCPSSDPPLRGGERSRNAANLRTKLLDFRGFDSSTIIISRGGFPRPQENVP